MQRLFRLSLLALILGFFAFGETNAQVVYVSGDVESGHVRIFVKDSVYRIDHDYDIYGTLIVEPGTVVRFFPNGRLIVHAGGRVIADGDAETTYNSNPDGINPLALAGSVDNPDGYEDYSDVEYFLRTTDYTPGAGQNTIDVNTMRDPTVNEDKEDYIFNLLLDKSNRKIVDLRPEDIGTQMSDNFAKIPFEKAIMFKAARLMNDPDIDVNLRNRPYQRVLYADPQVESATIEFHGQPLNDFSREWGHIIILPGARAAFFRNCTFDGFRKDTTVDRLPFYSQSNLPGLSQAGYNNLNAKMTLLTNGGGGAITTFSSRTWLLNCEFSNNMARYRGGAIQILEAPSGFPQYETEFGYYASDKNPNITNKWGELSKVNMNNPIPAIDMIDEPGSSEPLSYKERRAYDDGRIAVYLGRMRNLKFDGNFVQLANVKFTQIGNYRIVEDDTDNPADIQTIHNQAFGGAVYIAGYEGMENRKMEVGLGVNNSVMIDGEEVEFDDEDTFVATGNSANNYQDFASTEGARGGALYVGRYTSMIVAGEYSHNKTYTKFLQDTAAGSNSGYYSMGGAIFCENTLARLQVRGGPAREDINNQTHFYQNESGAGGAIYVDGGSVDPMESPVIGGCDKTAMTRDYGFNIFFEENSATSWGGAVFSNRHMSINGAGGVLADELIGYGGKYPVRFLNNKSGYAGGALHIQIPTDQTIVTQGPAKRKIHIVRAEFRGNVVGEGIDDINKPEIRGGGAIYSLNGDLNLVKATEFRENTVYNGNGGAICLVHPQSSFRRYFLTDLDNTADFTDPQTQLVTGYESRNDVFTFQTENLKPDQRMLTRFLDNQVICDDEILATQSGSGTTQVGKGTLKTSSGLYATTWLDNNNGYAVGYNGTIIKITNGGSNWDYQESGTNQRLNDVTFTSSDVGFAVGGTSGNPNETGVLLKTTDGGRNWNEVTLPVDKAINDIQFIGTQTGYAVCEDGYILKTMDGGDNWTYTRPETADLKGVFFTGQSNGFVVGERGLIIRTEDGGQTWDNQFIPGVIANLNSIMFIDNMTGFIFGNNGHFIKTVNGGASWVAISVASGDDFYSGYFTSATTGYAVGSYGALWKTDDGGSTWTQLDPGTSYSLHDIFFPSTMIGYIVGDAGLGLKTTDGGDNWVEIKPADESEMDVTRLHQEIMLPENGVGLGGALYVLDSVTVNRIGRVDSIYFNRVRIEDNTAYTGAAIYSDNYDLKLIFNRTFIVGNSVDERNTIGLYQNAIFGPVVRDGNDSIVANHASHDLAGAIIYGEIQGPLPNRMFSEAANSIYGNNARFLIRLPDAPNSKGVLAGTTGIGYGGTDTLRGNYWGHTEANVNLKLDNSQWGNTFPDETIETFFVESDGENHLWFEYPSGSLLAQGPFEFTYGYTYTPIPLANDTDENTPANETIPEQLLQSGKIYDAYDKGTDIKTADYTKRRMSPIEDFAVGIPATLMRFQNTDDPDLPSTGKYVKRWVRNPFDAEATDSLGNLLYPIINTLQDEYKLNSEGKFWHPIGQPVYLEAKADYEGLAEISNFDYRTLNETVFFVINETTGDYIRVNMKEVSNDAPLRETFRTRVELVPDSSNRNPNTTIRRTGEGLANFGSGSELLRALEDNPYNEDLGALPGRRYHANDQQLGGVNNLYSNRPGMPPSNNGTATYYAGERFNALPVNVGDGIRIISRSVLWKEGRVKAYDDGISFEVTREIEPPTFTGNIPTMQTDTIIQIRPSDYPWKDYDTLKLVELLNTIFVTEDRIYPVRDGWYEGFTDDDDPLDPLVGPNERGRDSILTITAIDTNNYYDPRSFLRDSDYARLTYHWSVAPNTGLARWLQVDSLNVADRTFQNPRDGAEGYFMFRGQPINPFVVPGGEEVSVYAENYPPQYRTLDSLKNLADPPSDDYISKFINLFPPYMSSPVYDTVNARYLQQDTIDIGPTHYRTDDYKFRIFVVDSVPRFLDPGSSNTLTRRVDKAGTMEDYVYYEGSDYPCGLTSDGKLRANLTDKLRFHVDFGTDDESEDKSPVLDGWDFRYGRTSYGFTNKNIRFLPGDTAIIDTTIYDSDEDGMEDDTVLYQIRPAWMANQYLTEWGSDSIPDPYAFDFTENGQLNYRIPAEEAYQLLDELGGSHDAMNTDTVFAVVVTDGHGGLNFKTMDIFINVQPKILPLDQEIGTLPAAKEDEDYNPQLLDSSKMIQIYDPNFGQKHQFRLIKSDAPDYIPKDPCYPEAGEWDLTQWKTTPDWLEINEESGLLYGTPRVKDAPRDEMVTVLVTDEDGLNWVKRFSLRVEKTNHLPDLDLAPIVRCVDEGYEYNDTILVIDHDLLREDEIETLSLEVIEPANGSIVVIPNQISGTLGNDTAAVVVHSNAFTATPGPDGKVTIRIKVTDADGEEYILEYKVRMSKETDFISDLLIENQLGAFETLQWGTAPVQSDASTGDGEFGEIGELDEDLCEYEHPPLPPVDVFDARWTIPTINGTIRSIYPRAVSTNGRYMYRGEIQPGGVNGRTGPAYPLRITWDKSKIPAIDDAVRNPAGSSWFIRDAASLGANFSVNMNTVYGHNNVGQIIQNGDLVTITINSTAIDKFVIYYDFISPVGPVAGMPAEVNILKVSPNPYESGDVVVDFGIPVSNRIKVDIVDPLGRVIATVADAPYTAGYHQLRWNGRDYNGQELTSGAYTVRLTSGGVTSAYPMIIIK